MDADFDFAKPYEKSETCCVRGRFESKIIRWENMEGVLEKKRVAVERNCLWAIRFSVNERLAATIFSDCDRNNIEWLDPSCTLAVLTILFS